MTVSDHLASAVFAAGEDLFGNRTGRSLVGKARKHGNTDLEIMGMLIQCDPPKPLAHPASYFMRLVNGEKTTELLSVTQRKAAGVPDAAVEVFDDAHMRRYRLGGEEWEVRK